MLGRFDGKKIHRIFFLVRLTPGGSLRKRIEGVYFLPGNIELSGLEVSLIGVISRETILREYVEKIKAFKVSAAVKYALDNSIECEILD